jgi:hypothetical protein
MGRMRGQPERKKMSSRGKAREQNGEFTKAPKESMSSKSLVANKNAEYPNYLESDVDDSAQESEPGTLGASGFGNFGNLLL